MTPSHIWHPYTRHSAQASGELPVIVRGDGPYLYDDTGRRYIDAIASWWCCNLGHGHPRIVEAIRQQAGELQHSILGNLSHPRAIELAERLAAQFEGPPRKVFFASDGASAVEAALKIAVQYWHNRGETRRTRFAALQDGYHGDTLGAVSVGYVDSFHAPFKPLLFPAHHLPAPDLRDDQLEAMASTLAAHADELAAVIVEPLCQGAAGMRMYRPEYLRRLAAICRERGILLIVDEIAMGMGRTGRMWAHEHADIQPDIVCVGKGLSAGALPISATVVAEELFQTFADEPEDHTFYHGHTFAGNPIAAAAAVETLRLYDEENIVGQAATGAAVLAGAVDSFSCLDGVANVRRLGMILAMDLVDAAGRPDPARAQRVRAALLAAGILARPLGHVVYMMPPLVAPAAVLEELVDGYRRAVAAET